MNLKLESAPFGYLFTSVQLTVLHRNEMCARVVSDDMIYSPLACISLAGLEHVTAEAVYMIHRKRVTARR